ncbi:TfuA-like protein [Streptomyces sp. NPDC127178]|uniref:TfuA-like protein n=1 Tax=unclassified Streptomyces TaxID=2593676 RepID=UPI00363F6A84
MSVHVFLGPTLSPERALAIVPDATIHPPAAHGDLLRLPVGPDDVVLIVDGFFHQRAPVRHKEILVLLARGATVVGCSSMGALRAAELHPHGMIGIGRVFQMFVDAEINADDEVAVAHAADDDFRAVGDPLVNIRYGLEQAQDQGVITADEALAVLRQAQLLPYTARSWRLILRGLRGERPDLCDRLAVWVEANRPDLDLKKRDAIAALTAIAGRQLPVPEGPPVAGPRWQTAYVQAWSLRYRTTSVGTAAVSRAAEIHYTQLFDPGFPQRWYEIAVRCMAGGPLHPRSGQLPAYWEDQLLQRATQQGIVLDTLREGQVNRWLTAAERGSLPLRDQLLRFLVRSSTLSPGVPITSDIDGWCEQLLGSTSRAGDGVVRSLAANQQMSQGDRRRTPRAIKASVLARDLTREWSLDDTDSQALEIAARDRGFASFATAVEVFRQFWAERRNAPAQPQHSIAAIQSTAHAPEQVTTS